jgi:hypothetical protein
MAALCRKKAEAFIAAWREWQKQPPRVFQDTEIKDADMASYSLLLVGGPDANRVTAQLAARLPLQIAAERVTIDGKDFPAKNAALQMLYPNPLNPERYVWIVAGTSTDGMYFSDPNPQRLSDWEYTIVDGRIPAYKQSASSLQTRVVSGMFDYNWRFSDSLAHPGDSEIRAKGRQIHRPKPNLTVDPKVSESYVGRYQIEKGPLLELFQDGKRLLMKLQGQSEADELLPESETEYDIPKYGVWMSFLRDASGKVTGFTGYQEGNFEATKLQTRD